MDDDALLSLQRSNAALEKELQLIQNRLLSSNDDNIQKLQDDDLELASDHVESPAPRTEQIATLKVERCTHDDVQEEIFKLKEQIISNLEQLNQERKRREALEVQIRALQEEHEAEQKFKNDLSGLEEVC